jgi:hypothetical protein
MAHFLAHASEPADPPDPTRPDPTRPDPTRRTRPSRRRRAAAALGTTLAPIPVQTGLPRNGWRPDVDALHVIPKAPCLPTPESAVETTPRLQ